MNENKGEIESLIVVKLENINELMDHIDQIKILNKNLQKIEAALNNTATLNGEHIKIALNQSTAAFNMSNANFLETRYEMRQLTQRVEGMESRINARFDELMAFLSGNS